MKNFSNLISHRFLLTLFHCSQKYFFFLKHLNFFHLFFINQTPNKNLFYYPTSRQQSLLVPLLKWFHFCEQHPNYIFWFQAVCIPLILSGASSFLSRTNDSNYSNYSNRLQFLGLLYCSVWSASSSTIEVAAFLFRSFQESAGSLFDWN